MMNRKAIISKELNAKHIKILEGLLKLPENRECAECKAKAPRWASVNIGVFICLYCSGIHRSLGVHISKVRSVTLDTWLPEQVAFLQSMGNDKSNAYWEAELPSNYSRGGIESFIRAKYVEKRWVPRDGKTKAPPPRVREEITSPRLSRPGTGDSSGEGTNNLHLYKEEKGLPTTTSENEGANFPIDRESPRGEKGQQGHCATNHREPPHQEVKANHQSSKDMGASDVKIVKHESPVQPTQVVPGPTPNDISQNSAVSKVKSSALNATPATPSPKVDYATELFRMLCMDDPAENDSSSSDTTAWVDFESDEEVSTKGDPKSSSGSKVHPEPKTEEVQNVSAPLTKAHTHPHQKHPTNDKQTFSAEKASAPPTGPIHHNQRLSMLAPNGGSLAVATGLPNGRSPTYPAVVSHQNVNGFQQPSLNGVTAAHSMGTQIQMQNGGPGKFVVSSAPSAMSSPYRPTMPMNRISTDPSKKPPTGALPVSGYDYDFSFLTQGLFSKR